MHVVGDGLVARLRLTGEGVEVCSGEVRFVKDLDQHLLEGEVV